MSATERFHEVANDALLRISEHLWPGAKLALVVYEPGKPKLDIVLKDQGLDLDEVLSTLRRSGLSIDGDNAYKRDLLDAVVGALALGAQNNNPPPASHWGQRFWDIGREERGLHEELVAALTLAVERWTVLANEFKYTTPEHERELAEISKARATIAKTTQ
ncbi:hypothetical protein [Pseudomonas atagonensis]|uniref:hypothetical protein n=1 Tax=Pseudomonas atagonensis TaxID=2609964 RepID=UPI001407FAEB|nr:hypothetical protein [Pseudomonas atagonensis]